MSTISAILEPSPDGTLHVPVPEAWRKLPIRIQAEMEPPPADGECCRTDSAGEDS